MVRIPSCPCDITRLNSSFSSVIEDFFRLLVDALIYYHNQLIPASICGPILSASISVLVLQQQAPLHATLHYLRDFLSYGSNHPASSAFNGSRVQPLSLAVQNTVKQHVAAQGKALVERLLTGMMFSFPRDCLQDASGVLMSLFELLPEQAALWVKSTIEILPAGSIKAGEADRVMNNVAAKVQAGDYRKLRAVLQGMISRNLIAQWQTNPNLDFTTSYRRRNVAPRDGLGILEPKRFRYNG